MSKVATALYPSRCTNQLSKSTMTAIQQYSVLPGTVECSVISRLITFTSFSVSQFYCAQVKQLCMMRQPWCHLTTGSHLTRGSHLMLLAYREQHLLYDQKRRELCPIHQQHNWPSLAHGNKAVSFGPSCFPCSLTAQQGMAKWGSRHH